MIVREKRLKHRERGLVKDLPREMFVKCYPCDGEGHIPSVYEVGYNICSGCQGWGMVPISPEEQVATV